MTADRRRTAILDAAAQLLATRGWEEVTINEILAAAGISRGGFYHHFSSKDDILPALVLRFADATTAAATTRLMTSGAGVIERLSAFLRGAIEWELDHADQATSIVRLAKRPGNGPVFLGLSQEYDRRTRPALKDLLSEGVEQGIFDLPDVGMTADLFLCISRTRWLEFTNLQDAARAGRTEDARARLHRRVRAEQQGYERLLGLRAGSIELLPALSFEDALL